MKKLGIIGGAGPLASALLYETLIYESLAIGQSVPEIVLLNYPFSRGLSIEEGKNNEQTIEKELEYCLSLLSCCSVDIALLACNTLHLFLKRLATSIEFYHLPSLVLRAAQQYPHKRLLVLGTQNTRHSGLYQHAQMEISYPSKEEQSLVEEVIDRVLQGRILRQDADLMGAIIKSCISRDAIDGVILGCSDFPVLHHHFPIQTALPIYDSIKIPAKTLVGTII